VITPRASTSMMYSRRGVIFTLHVFRSHVLVAGSQRAVTSSRGQQFSMVK